MPHTKPHSLLGHCLAFGGFPITTCGTGGGISWWHCCSQTPRSQGWGRTQGRGNSAQPPAAPLWSCTGISHQRRSLDKQWSTWQRLRSQSSPSLCCTTEAERRRNFSLWEAWNTLALCRGNSQLRHTCQQGPTGDC